MSRSLQTAAQQARPPSQGWRSPHPGTHSPAVQIVPIGQSGSSAQPSGSPVLRSGPVVIGSLLASPELASALAPALVCAVVVGASGSVSPGAVVPETEVMPVTAVGLVAETPVSEAARPSSPQAASEEARARPVSPGTGRMIASSRTRTAPANENRPATREGAGRWRACASDGAQPAVQ